MKRLVLLFCLLATLTPAARAADAPKFEFKDGDRVAFIGNTFVEREQKDCYIETAITSRYPDRNITFRNLGYSGDTADGAARGLCSGWDLFEGADKAFLRLKKLVAEYKPTVLMLNYGMTESFLGPDQIPEFISTYGKTLDALIEAAGTSPRIVLLSPNYHEDLGRPLPDPSAHNASLLAYSKAIEELAAKRQAVYLNIIEMTKSVGPQKLTFNGIHLTHFGYWLTAAMLDASLSNAPRVLQIDITADGKVAGTKGGKVSDAGKTGGVLKFTVVDDMLPLPPLPPPFDSNSPSMLTPMQTVKISGLAPGSYELKADGQPAAKASAQEWAAGVNLVRPGPEGERAESLRKLIVAKNFDYFNYQRPDNDSYILAFRKKEQGRNAVEIPQFLPLVEEKEKQIAELKVPKPVTYTLQLAK